MASEWSTINMGSVGNVSLINDDIIIYVATTGNDTTGDGTYSKPYKTPHKAFDWLKNKQISSNARVTIKCAAGIYNLDSLHINHPFGSNIILAGEEEDSYDVRGCRGATFGVGTYTHTMNLTVSTAGYHDDANHGAAGYTTEHNLDNSDVNNAYMIITHDDGGYDNAARAFYGSLTDNNSINSMTSWGSGCGSTAGLQWIRIAGLSKITGQEGTKGRAEGDAWAKPTISIQKYMNGISWGPADVWSSRGMGDDRGEQRRYYNDIEEKASHTVGGSRFGVNENIGIVAEYGGNASGHTADHDRKYFSTDIRIQANVIRTIFDFGAQNYGIWIHNSALGAINNIIMRRTPSSPDDGSVGIRISENSELGLTADSKWVTNKDDSLSRLVGVEGFDFGWLVEDSTLSMVQCAANGNWVDDQHFGSFGICAQSGSNVHATRCYSSSFDVNFKSADSSYLMCNNSVASHSVRKPGWIMYDNDYDFAEHDNQTINAGDWLRQEDTDGTTKFEGRAKDMYVGDFRIRYELLSGIPSNDWDLLVSSESRGGPWATAVPAEFLTSTVWRPAMSGIGFHSNSNSTMIASNSYAYGVGGYGFYSSNRSYMTCINSVAAEICISGYRTYQGDMIAQDSTALRCGIGYYDGSGGRGLMAPATNCVNNIRWNYYSAGGRIIGNSAKSYEGFDKSLESHLCVTHNSSAIMKFEKDNSVYSAAWGGRGLSSRIGHADINPADGDGAHYPNEIEFYLDGKYYDGTNVYGSDDDMAGVFQHFIHNGTNETTDTIADDEGNNGHP